MVRLLGPDVAEGPAVLEFEVVVFGKTKNLVLVFFAVEEEERGRGGLIVYLLCRIR